ncbi:MAG: hypothetical protein ABSE66_00115 [Thermoplasmata archaeon]|jgi:hypothetical protein
MLDEKQDDSPREEEEDVLRERVRGIDLPGSVHDRCHDQEDQSGPDGIPPIQPGPHRIDQVGEEETDKDRGVRDVHRSGIGSGPGLLSYSGHPSNSRHGRPRPFERLYNVTGFLVRLT